MPRSFCRHALAWVSTLALFACLSAQVPARKPADDSIHYSQNGQPYRRAADQTAWRQIPTLVQPPSGSAVDEARGVISDKCCAASHALDLPGPLVTEIEPTDYDGQPPELAFPIGDAVVVGTFDSAKSILSPTHLSIYTILRIAVSTVISPGNMQLSGRSLDVMKRGGRVAAADGRILKLDYRSAWLGPQPGHRYLFVLRYSAAGDFYVIDDEWELRDGAALPDTDWANAAARRGLSHLAGKPESEFLREVREMLASQTAGGGQ